MEPASDSLKTRNNRAAALMVDGQWMQAYNQLYVAMEKAALASTIIQQGNQRVTFRSPLNVMALTTKNLLSNPATFHKHKRAMFPWPLVSLGSNYDDTENLDGLSVAAAVALFNMGLACHQSLFTARREPALVTETERDQMLAQAEYRYLQAYEMGQNYDVEILNIALLINLMEIAYERGDLTALQSWALLFYEETKRVSWQNPEELLQCIWTAHLYFTVGLFAARAA